MRETVPTITVRFFAAAREAFGVRESEVEASSLDDLVARLSAEATAEATTVLGRSSFLVNAVARTDRSAPLAPGDTVDVLPPFAGG